MDDRDYERYIRINLPHARTIVQRIGRTPHRPGRLSGGGLRGRPAHPPRDPRGGPPRVRRRPLGGTGPARGGRGGPGRAADGGCPPRDPAPERPPRTARAQPLRVPGACRRRRDPVPPVRRAARLADALTMNGAGGKLALVGASLLFCAACLGAAEVLLRSSAPEVSSTAPALQPYVYSPSYGWRLRPGWKGRTRDGRTVAINARGFRGPPPEAASRDGPEGPAPGRLDHLRHGCRRPRDLRGPARRAGARDLSPEPGSERLRHRPGAAPGSSAKAWTFFPRRSS